MATNQDRVLTLAPEARLTRVPVGAGKKYSQTRWHYHIWRPSDFGQIETLALVECYSRPEASAWKVALAYLKAQFSDKRP